MKFTYISSRGDILPLLNNENFKITGIDGQTSIASNISSVVTSGDDGDIVNNVYAQPRTINIDLRIIKDIEITKRKILSIVKVKQEGTIQWEQDGKVVQIKGIVEAIEMPRWSKGVTMQITLHCGQPFWEDVEKIISDINEVVDVHYFTTERNDMLYFPEEGIPFGEYDTTRTRLIHNAGDVSVGMKILIVAYNTVTNPIIKGENEKYFGVGYGTGNKKVVMQAGDVIQINTLRNEKSVTLNGQNMLSKIKPNSTWLQLEAGDNTFSIDSDEEIAENMTFSIEYIRRYV